MLLIFLSVQNSAAQFYRRNDSIAKIVKSGVSVERKRLNDAGNKKKQRKKTKTTKKKSATAGKIKSAKKDSVIYRRSYKLGDRVIMRGDSGADVKKVAEILVNNLFIEEKNVPYTRGGQVLYDGELIKALKLFQKVEGMYEDGVIATPTIKALKRYNSRGY